MVRCGLLAVREAKANAPRSPTNKILSSTLKRKKRTSRKTTPGGLEKSIEYEASPVHCSVYVSQNSFARLVSARKPFGLSTTDVGHELKKSGDVLLYKRGGRAFFSKNNIIKNIDWLNKYKIYITKAYGASDEWPHQIINKPIIGEVGSCCSETYLVIGPFANKEICSNVVSYMETRLFRFMVSLRKISQDATQSVYQFVPMQDFSKPWTDEELYKKYNLTADEIKFIESMIKPME
jgi:site-specific DNA-methyltransferase (adenine-specific)